MARALLAGAYDVEGYALGSDELIFTSKTILDSNFNVTVTAEEARAGQGNYLIGRFYHTSGLALSLTDQVWDINYLSMQTGASITGGGDFSKTVKATVNGGKITISEDARPFANSTQVSGWYKLPTATDYVRFAFEADNRSATLIGIPDGTEVCVRYIAYMASGRSVKINTDVTPMILRLVLKGKKFVASGSGTQTVQGSSQSGVTQIEIPLFQFDGGQELGLSSTSFATASLNGSALAVLDSTGDCTSESTGGYYAIWSEYDTGSSEFDSVKSIVVENADIELTAGDVHKLNVYKLYSDNTSPTLVDNANLTFTSATPAVATVDAKGIITAVATGSVVIEVTATSQPELVSVAQVTIS